MLSSAVRDPRPAPASGEGNPLEAMPDRLFPRRLQHLQQEHCGGGVVCGQAQQRIEDVRELRRETERLRYSFILAATASGFSSFSPRERS